MFPSSHDGHGSTSDDFLRVGLALQRKADAQSERSDMHDATPRDDGFESAADDAYSEGHAAGVAAGSWVIDGNTSEESVRAILRGIEEGDPAVLDSLPSSPLSGEWADAPLPRDVLARYGMSEEDDAADDVLRSYEDGFAHGVEDEVTRSARAVLS